MVSMRRICALFLLAAVVALPQKISVGVKGGVPLTDALKVTGSSGYFSDKAPFVIGPAVELRLPLGLSAEADLLYRRLQYGAPAAADRTTGQVWEVPLLAKGRLPSLLIFTPFVSAGFSFRRFANLSNGKGPTLGGGLEAKLPHIRLSAEMRYTRWGASTLKAALSGLTSQLNQADVMLGIMF
jgi:hypothetical protein